MKSVLSPGASIYSTALYGAVTCGVALAVGMAVAVTGDPLVVAALAVISGGLAAFTMAGSGAARRSLVLSGFAVCFVMTGRRFDTGFIVLEPWLMLFPLSLAMFVGNAAITKTLQPLDRIGVLALLVMVTAWLSYFGAIDVMTWLKRAMKVTWLFGLYYIVVSWASEPRHLRTLLRASFWACAAAATATIGQATVRWTAGGFGEVFGAAGLFANSNEGATYMALFVVMGISLYAARVHQRVVTRPSLLLLLCIIGLGILFSRSRTGLMSALAVSMLLFIRTARVRRLLVLVLAFLVLLALTPAAVLLSRLTGTLGISGDENLDAFMRGGDVGRLYLVQLYWTVIKAYPVFGVGAANYGFINQLGLAFPQPPPGLDLSPETYLRLTSHNGYVNWWLETGTLGFAAFAGSLICATVSVWRARRLAVRDPDPWWRAVATGTFGGLIVFMLTNFGGEFGVSETRYWLLMALTSISVRHIKARAASSGRGRMALAHPRLRSGGSRA